MLGDERILMCVKRWRQHYIGAWATIFSFEATLSEEVMASASSLKNLAVRSELTGITQNINRPRFVQAMALLHDSVAVTPQCILLTFGVLEGSEPVLG